MAMRNEDSSDHPVNIAAPNPNPLPKKDCGQPEEFTAADFPYPIYMPRDRKSLTLTHRFSCQLCGSRHFGSFLLPGEPITGRRGYMCHDEYGVGCRQTFEDPSLCFTELRQEMPDPLSNIQWLGDNPATMPPADMILASFPLDRISDEQIRKAGDFYSGRAQWDAEQEKIRLGKGRPTLIINFLPQLFAAALESQRKAGYPELTDKQKAALQIVLALRNMDAQKLYNYMASAAAERGMIEVERCRRVAAKEAGA